MSDQKPNPLPPALRKYVGRIRAGLRLLSPLSVERAREVRLENCVVRLYEQGPDGGLVSIYSPCGTSLGSSNTLGGAHLSQLLLVEEQLRALVRARRN